MRRRRIFALLAVISLMFSLIPGVGAKESPVTVIVNGSELFNWGVHFEMLLNVFREQNSIYPLEENETLSELAHQRAAEIALYYSEDRTRPDGSEGITILEGKYEGWTVFEELIAIGPANASDALEYWMSTPDSKATLLSSAYTDIGISCFEVGGTFIWVLFFSDSNSGRGSYACDEDAWHFVSVLPSNLHLNQSEKQSITLASGESTVVRLFATNPGWEGLEVPLVMYGYHIDSDEGVIPACDPYRIQNGNGYVELRANYFPEPIEDTVTVYLYENQPNPLQISVTVLPEGMASSPVPDHEHTPIVLDAIQPVCSINGYTGNTFCAECHFLLTEGENIPALDHAWSDCTVSRYPDAQQDDEGLKWQYCTGCGFTRETTVFSEEHPHSDGHSITVTGSFGDWQLSITSARAGHEVFLCAIPDRGYEFAGIEISCSAAETPELTVDGCYVWFTMPDSPVELALEFIPEASYDIILNTNAGGTASATPNPAYEGEEVSLYIQPDEGYVVDSVTITGNGSYEPEVNQLSPEWYMITMPDGDLIVDVTFAPVPSYRIEVYTTDGGTAYVDTASVVEDDYVILSVFPEEGYMIDQILLYTDGTYSPYGEQISETEFSIRIPDGNVVIEVYFVLSDNPFNDVKERDYFYKPVMWAISNEITSGISASRFGPNNACTRAQVVTFLWAAAGKPEPRTAVNPFTDVKETDYFYKAVLWAVENGITSGMDGTTFGSSRPCTRAQVVTFLWAALDRPEPTSYYNPFTDVKETDYFYEAVLFAVEYGITSGMSATRFGSGNTCTRAHVVTFLYKTFHG